MSKINNHVLEKLRKESPHVKLTPTQNNSKNIIAYIRVSNAKQVDNYSPEVQKNAIKRDAELNGYKIVKTFNILGESSKRGSKRPSIKALLEFIDNTKHKIHLVVAFRSDRFGRDGRFGDEFLDELIERGVGFRDIEDPQDIFTDRGRLKQARAFYDAEYDNLNRKHFINAITLEKLIQGYTMRTPPRGYKLIKRDKKKGIEQKVFITDEGKLIQQAFRLKIDYNYSNVMIAEIMKSRGLKITDKALGAIFKNVYYCGFIKDTRLIDYGGYVEGRHPAMITPDEYDILNCNKAYKRQIRRNEHEQLPLKKYLICNKCKQKLTGYPATNRDNLFYYKCGTKGCGVNINSNLVNDTYRKYLKRFSFNKNHLPQLNKMLDEVFKMVNKSNKQIQRSLKAQITQLEKDRKLAIRNYNTDIVKNAVLLELIDVCDDDLAALKEQLAGIKVGTKEIRNNIFQALNFINDISEIWWDSDLVFKLKLQELIFPDGIYYDKQSNSLKPTTINPIFGLAHIFKGKVKEFEKIEESEKSDLHNQNLGGKNDINRTSDFIENMPVNPSKIWGHEHCNNAFSGNKIPLVAVTSGTSNNLISEMQKLLHFLDRYYLLISGI